jgi:hypothetical protein
LEATEFDHIPVAIELLRSKEYLHVIEADSATGILGIATAFGTDDGAMYVPFPVRMSGIPTVSTPGDDSELDITDWAGTGTDPPVFSASGDLITPDFAMLQFTDASSGMAADDNYIIQKDGSATTQYIIIFSNEV